MATKPQGTVSLRMRSSTFQTCPSAGGPFPNFGDKEQGSSPRRPRVSFLSQPHPVPGTHQGPPPGPQPEKVWTSLVAPE